MLFRVFPRPLPPSVTVIALASLLTVHNRRVCSLCLLLYPNVSIFSFLKYYFYLLCHCCFKMLWFKHCLFPLSYPRDQTPPPPTRFFSTFPPALNACQQNLHCHAATLCLFPRLLLPALLSFYQTNDLWVLESKFLWLQKKYIEGNCLHLVQLRYSNCKELKGPTQLS